MTMERYVEREGERGEREREGQKGKRKGWRKKGRERKTRVGE